MTPTSPATYVLPDSFRPSINEVIIGRGKRIAEHCGNKRLHSIVKGFVEEYSAAPTKRQKSAILTKVVTIIRNSSIQQAGFVKQDTLKGGWCIVEDAAARITVAQAFRDALHSNYKSSKQFKQARRQDKKGGGVCREGLDASLSGRESPGWSPNGTNGLLRTMNYASSMPSEEANASSSPSLIPVPPVPQPQGLSNLLRVLEESIDLSNDPFEPTPIPEGSAASFPALPVVPMFNVDFLSNNLNMNFGTDLDDISGNTMAV
jgi:hypothetical protein